MVILADDAAGIGCAFGRAGNLTPQVQFGVSTFNRSIRRELQDALEDLPTSAS